MDALTQLIEPYVCNQPNPLTDALCRDGIMRIANNLRDAYFDGKNNIARKNMAIASLFSGLALANAKLGAVHGFAGVLGGMYGAPHGEICAILLPYVIEVNLEALHSREPDNPALSRYREINKMVVGSEDERDLIDWVLDLCELFNIPKLRSIGITEKDFETVIEKASHASSMKGNPIKLTREELLTILEYAY
jgi:alcohol dehydrogenase class IV